MTLMSTPPTAPAQTVREPARTLREKGAHSFHAALAAVLVTALDEALASGDHERAVTLVNRGFAEGSPQLGCDLLCRAMAVVGTARTWTVQLAPPTRAGSRFTS
ncbi:hypothetical protein [Actinoplanes sp. M2I2]|uniref:hypothetical protein n=1 Tax=Actinoplanes sp. M2I2 TaxID=1734444 RepID=UPI0020222BA5|nr:hypothetical protein [Actinoplanes sp. M2I2]